jgi:hypothetical protein
MYEYLLDATRINNTPVERTHYSFVLRKNKVLALGKEYRGKTHPLAMKYGYKYPTIHSELDAFRQLHKADLRDGSLVLVNTRISSTGVLGMARPCRYCMGWVQEIFDEIWYTNQEGLLVKL